MDNLDALAAKFGGSVAPASTGGNLDALAAKFGGSVVQSLPKQQSTQGQSFGSGLPGAKQMSGQDFINQPFIKQVAQAFVATLPKDIYDFAIQGPMELAKSAGEAPTNIAQSLQGKPITSNTDYSQIPIIGKALNNTPTLQSQAQTALNQGAQPGGWHAFILPAIKAAADGLITAEELKSTVATGAKLFGDAPINDLGQFKPGVIQKMASSTGNVVNNTTNTIREGITNFASNAKNVATSGKDLETAKSMLEVPRAEQANIPFQKLDITNQVRELNAAKRGGIQDMTTAFKNTVDELQSKLTNESQVQSALNKGTLKTLFNDITDTYGKGLDQAEQALINRGTTISSQNYLDSVVNKTLEDAKNFGIPEDNGAYKAVKGLQEDITSQYPQKSMSLSDLTAMKNKIYDEITAAVKSGNKYGSADDLLANTFLKNHGSFIGEMSPELKQLNQEFAPMANARNWAMKTFKPYNAAEVQRGANVLEKLAIGKPDATSLNYLKTLEEGSGRFEGSGSLNGSTTKIGNNIEDVKNSFNIAKQNLISSTDYQISNLKSELAGLQSKDIKLSQDISKQKEIINQLKYFRGIRNKVIGTVFTAVGLGAIGKWTHIIP